MCSLLTDFLQHKHILTHRKKEQIAHCDGSFII